MAVTGGGAPGGTPATTVLLVVKGWEGTNQSVASLSVHSQRDRTRQKPVSYHLVCVFRNIQPTMPIPAETNVTG